MSRNLDPRLQRRDDERGMIAVFTAVVATLALFTVAAIAIDIGSQRVARRDMQAMADIVALDLARLIDGRTRAQIESGYGSQPALATALSASVANNDDHTAGAGDGCGGAPCVTPYLVDVDADGNWPKDANELPVQVADGEVPDGVVVFANTTVGFSFGIIASGSATRFAAGGVSEPSMCFSLGTKALALDSSESVLSPVLSGILGVNLSAVGYDGLVDVKEASVPVAGLMAELNIGSVSQLAGADVTFNDLVIATAEVLRANGDAANATVLDSLRANVASANLFLGDILALQAGSDPQALSADVNVLELLTASAVAANGSNAIALSIPGVTEVRIIEPPVIACGAQGVQAQTAQVRFSLDLNLGTVPPADADVIVDIDVQVAEGVATLDSLECSPASAGFTISTGVVTVPPISGGNASLETDIDVTVLGIPLAGVDLLVALNGGVGTRTESHEVSFPAPPGMPGTITVPTGGLGSTLNLSVSDFTASASLGLLVTQAQLDIVVGPLAEDLVDAVDGLLTPTVNALTDALGMKLGVAELEPTTRPICDAVRLIG